MARRSKAGGKSVTARRRKPIAPKRRTGPKIARRRGPASDPETKVARLTRELNEALAQQTATADVLKVISRSTFDLQTVLDTLSESAARLCAADKSAIMQRDGEVYWTVALYGMSPEAAQYVAEHPLPADRGSATGRAALEGRAIHVLDVLADPEYRATGYQQAGTYRTALAVPLLRGETTIGVIALMRDEMNPFTEKQIALVETFADQAAIAIENVRLFETEQQRTRELTESLAQQTATSEVLRVISSSPGDLQPVFESVLENATRICQANFGLLALYEGDAFRVTAMHNAPPAFAEVRKREPVIRPGPLTRLAATKQMIHIADLTEEPAYREGNPAAVAFVELAGARTILGMPMLKDNELVGVITIYRREVQLFTDKQVEILRNFAAQAVIAIENARLLTELRQRTTDLTESLEQQTATTEVLQVISSSPGDLEPVFQAALENATRLCGASYGNLLLWEGDAYRMAAVYGDLPLIVQEKWRPGTLLRPGPEVPIARVARTHQVVHVADLREDPAYLSGDPLPVLAAEVAGTRTLVAIPMLKEDELIGAIVIYRKEVRPFPDKQIELVTNFAAQAVIAIENARLLSELRESLEQQTAMAEVLRVISSSPGDLKPVFDAVLANAVRICHAKFGNMALFDGTDMRVAAMYNAPRAFEELRAGDPVISLDRSILGTLVKTKKRIHVHDVAAEEPYASSALARLAGARSALAVPMLRDDNLVGALAIYDQEARPFTDKQIELLGNFAAQAVIAIENARLLSELRRRTDDLTESLEQQTATAKVLEVISRSAFDLQAVFETVVESSARLCGADRAFIFRFEGELLHVAATYNAAPEFEEWVAQHPIRPGRHSASARAALERRTIHIADVLADPEYSYAVGSPGVEAFRTVLGVPILKGDDLLGTMVIYHLEVRPFTDKQIALVETFADQAAIAIENVRLFEAEQQRTRELTESLEQQTATSEVLQVISSSPGDLEPVFRTMLEKAIRISGAKFGIIHSWDGEHLRLLATHNLPPAFDEARRRAPEFRPGPKTGIRRMAATKSVIHIPDLLTDEGYLADHAPQVVAAAEQGGVRTMLAVPMLKENEVVGAFTVYRQEVRPFTDKQIKLLENFAAQAVIAIENTRLLTELRQRTADLTESLEQQTATSEVLQVISSSPGDLEPVFESMLANATRLCEAPFGGLFLRDAGVLRIVASHVPPSAPAAIFHRGSELILSDNPTHPLARIVVSKELAHIIDMRTDQSYIERNARIAAFVETVGARTVLCVPMLKDNDFVGAFFIFRREVRPFADKQIDLVKNFAAQAVIAIENARLLTELRQRTDDLTESLEQQTATSEVLQVISSSPGDLQPVFATMLEKAVRICDATFGNIYGWDGAALNIVASLNTPAAFAEARRKSPLRPGPKNAVRQMVESTATIHIPDVAASEAYAEREPVTVEAVEIAGIRTFLAVPMLKESGLAGAIALARQEVRPFTDKQIALVTSFAAQAVIAIENTRLLTELRQRTDELGRSVGELRALGEVSQAVNSTLDLETVLSTIVAKAVQLSTTDAGAIYVYDEADREFHLRATYGMDQELIDALRRQHIGLDEPNVALAFEQSEPIQVADLQNEVHSDLNEITLRAGFRARLVAPLLRGAEIVGMLVVRRRTPGAFPPNTVDLIKTFAAQSVLAIQNARLFENVETRTRELATSLRELQTAQDRLVQTEKLASLGQLTAGIAHEIKNPLNFVNNFSSLSVELIDELQEGLQGIALDEKTRTDITELADMLRGNLDKVVQHGKRADSIVKNMLLHSRQGSGERQPADINAIVEESLNLAYHGARAEKQSFNITLQRSFDPAAGKVELFPQEITRVLLNLIANGFYAATKRKAETDGGYEPTLAAATKNLGDSVEIRIRDNGTGIPPEVRERMFNPFFTTKPAGEGTGLGLSLSHDIIVKQHAGSIEVDTRPGEFTEFRIVLPRGAAAPAKTGGNT
jgi:two-component system, NtrC family, sensor kinase